MARKNYYQKVGNPLQRSRLPNRRPELELPHWPESPRRDTRFALKMLCLFAGISAAGVLLHAGNLCQFGSLGASTIITNAILVGLALFCVVRSIRKWDGGLAQYPLGCVMASLLIVNLPIPPACRLLVATAVLGLLTWLMATHWTGLCTASPLGRSTARRLRRSWNGFLALAAVVPTIAGIIGQMAGVVVAGFVLMSFIACQCIVAARVPGSAGPFRTAWRALSAWLVYNCRDADPPGIYRSPAGGWLARMSVTGLCVFLLSATLFSSLRPAGNLGALISDRDTARHMHDPAAAEAPVPATSTTETSVGLFVVLAAAALALFVVLLVLPALITATVPLALTLPVLVQATAYQRSRVDPDGWRTLIEDIGQSVDPVERDSLFMGRIAHDGSPLLLPRKLLREHAHFLGDSGSGKTSLGLAPLLEQLAAMGDCSVVAIDLKADSMELPATLIAAADRGRRQAGRRIPIKHFCNQLGRSTFAFNPLRQPYWQDLDLYVRTDILCGALGLTYGVDYGEGFYSSANSAVLYHTIKTFPEVVTFWELAERVGWVMAHADRSELHPEIRKAGAHVQTILHRLGSFEALNVTPEGNYSPQVIAESIDFTKPFTRPEIHYFHLPSTLAPGSSPEIARLVTYSLLAAATQVQRRHQVYLVVDEFQRMVARNIEYILQLARSMDVGVILANQTMQDLRTSTADLIPPIEANCRYRQWFAVSSAEDRQRLVEGSGHTVDLHMGWSYGEGPKGETASVSYQEHIAPRLDVNDILLASDHPKQSVVRISRGEGYAQFGGMPFILESDYHITQREYERRRGTLWPEGVLGSFIPSGSAAPPSPPPPPPPPGPVVTGEILDSSSEAAVAAADLFQSYMDSSASAQPNAGSRKKGERK